MTTWEDKANYIPALLTNISYLSTGVCQALFILWYVIMDMNLCFPLREILQQTVDRATNNFQSNKLKI